MLRNVPNYNRMFYFCFTKENDVVKHLCFKFDKYDNN